MTELALIQPPQELIDILVPALGPCPAMRGKCQGHVRWDPEKGYVPRGYRGATGRLEEVELVLVCAEPGDAYDGERYDGPTALDKLCSAYTHSCWHIEEPQDRFGRNMREILNIAFPGLSVAEQLRRTWITEAVLCSAPQECGDVAPEVEQECRERYLVPQLKLFPNARIVLLGGKAQKRLGVWPEVRQAFHPACRPRDQQAARESWVRALEGLGQSNLEEARSRTAVQAEAVRDPPQVLATRPARLLPATDGWNRTYSGPNAGAQTEFIERALTDVPRTAEEIAEIANLICGKQGFVKPDRVTRHLTYHHLTLGAAERARRGDTKLRMPQLIYAGGGRWAMPSSLRPQ